MISPVCKLGRDIVVVGYEMLLNDHALNDFRLEVEKRNRSIVVQIIGTKIRFLQEGRNKSKFNLTRHQAGRERQIHYLGNYGIKNIYKFQTFNFLFKRELEIGSQEEDLLGHSFMSTATFRDRHY